MTLDDNGRMNQQFIEDLTYGSTTNNRHIFALTLNEDGTCTVNYNIIKNMGSGDRIVSEKYEGTYSVDGDFLTVNYNEEDHVMIIDNNKIHFFVLSKVE